MIDKTALVALAGILCVSAAFAADSEIDRARTLMKIEDYAGAVGKLHELAQNDPTNAEVRILMARCFAESRVKLDVPATVSPGSNNDERAIYQLTILTKLEKSGESALIDAIRTGGPRLAPLAIRVAGQSRIAGAVDAIAAVGSAEKVDADLQAEAAWALVQMKSERAAPLVKAALDRLGQDHPLCTTMDGGGRKRDNGRRGGRTQNTEQ